MNYGNLDQKKRDNLLKEKLSVEKVKLIEKFGLKSTENLMWISQKENCHEQILFKQSYAEKNDILRLLFRVNRLCFAKVNYFSEHKENFEPHIYDFEKGFISKTGGMQIFSNTKPVATK